MKANVDPIWWSMFTKHGYGHNSTFVAVVLVVVPQLPHTLQQKLPRGSAKTHVFPLRQCGMSPSLSHGRRYEFCSLAQKYL